MKFWPVIPAAGVGRRMGADRPKQYLSLQQACRDSSLSQDRLLIDITLDTLLGHNAFESLVLVLSDEDGYWQDSEFHDDSRIIRAPGGDERCQSVMNGLSALSELADDDDWVLVHDVARPCISHQDLDQLIDFARSCSADDCGALLAVPVRDTMKRAGARQRVDHTVDRDGLWHALTPQMFRYRELSSALAECLQKSLLVTDEASAMEQLGKQPVLVEGSANNIKVTRPDDLALAEFFLSRHARG